MLPLGVYFVIGIVWSKAYTKVWTNVCKLFVNIASCTLAECKRRCEEIAGCNAINYNEGNRGVLRQCPLPIPRPSWTLAGSNGYHIIGIYNLKYNLWFDNFYNFDNFLNIILQFLVRRPPGGFGPINCHSSLSLSVSLSLCLSPV